VSQISIFPVRDDLPRGGAGRAVAVLANVLALVILNRPEAFAGVAIGADPKKVGTDNAIPYSISGATRQLPATDDLWTLTGPVVPPGSWQKWALLVDEAGAPFVQEATPSFISANDVGFSNVAPNGLEVLIKVLNGGTGRAIIGGVVVATNDSTTFTPNVTPLNAPGLRVGFVNGLPSGALLAAIGTSVTQLIDL